MGCCCCKRVENSNNITTDNPETEKPALVYHLNQVSDDEPIRDVTPEEQYAVYSVSPIQERQTRRNLNDKAFVRERLKADNKQF